MDFHAAPFYVKDYLMYLTVVTGKSPKTVYEYYLDLINFFRFVKRDRTNSNQPIESIDIFSSPLLHSNLDL